VSVFSGESRTSGLFISNKEDLFRDAL